MAHETNRFTAATKARDSGMAQVTGPIVLVQDSGKTPGFLFYAPFYENQNNSTQGTREESFLGMVYAPIVVQNLMEGVLDKENRQVGIQLLDGDEVLYDEHITQESDYDPNPQYTMKREVTAYGRTWVFDIWSANSFREAQRSSQPMIILVGGLLIDSLLVMLFLTLTRGNK